MNGFGRVLNKPVLLFSGPQEAGKGIDRGHGLALQKDGKIVATAFSVNGITDEPADVKVDGTALGLLSTFGI
jgi:hypothetical protein